jgi:hypothetical protein
MRRNRILLRRMLLVAVALLAWVALGPHPEPRRQRRRRRFLWSLTDPEVEERIFERHNDPPPERSAIFEPSMAPTYDVPNAMAPSNSTVPMRAPVLRIPSVANVPTLGATLPVEQRPTKTPTLFGVPSTVEPLSNGGGGANITPVGGSDERPTVPLVTDAPNAGPNNTAPAVSSMVPTLRAPLPVPTGGINTTTLVPVAGNATLAPTPLVNTTTLVPVAGNATLTPTPLVNTTTLLPVAGNATLAPTPLVNTTTLVPVAGNATLAPTPLLLGGNSTTRAPVPTVGGNATLAPVVVLGNTTLAPVGAGNASSLVPTPTEDTLQFLVRSLQLPEQGAISQPGTPAHQAYTDLTVHFPDVTPTNAPEVLLQIFVLNVLFYSTNGTQWKDRTGWTTGPNDPCTDWFGVVCSDDGVVRELQLTSNDLLGTIPSELQGLSQLGRWRMRLFTLVKSLPPFSHSFLLYT